MKKILLAIALLTSSFAANAYRQEYGQFGNWDAYYLSKSNGEQLCALRGYFNGNYKVIFNYLREPDGRDYAKINIENPQWAVPQGEYYVDINVLDQYGNPIKYGKGIFSNLTGHTVSQVSIIVLDNTLRYIQSGFTLQIITPTRTLSFDIGSLEVNQSFRQLQQCAADKFTPYTPPQNVIQQQPYAPLTKF